MGSGESAVSRRLTLFVALVTSAGVFAIVESVRTFPFGAVDLMVLALFVVLTAFSQRVQVVLFRSSAISVSLAYVIASYVLFGTGVGVLVTLVETAVNAFTPKRKAPVKVVFNGGALAISAYVGGTIYGLAGGSVPPTDIATTLIAVTLSAAAYFAMNTLLTATVIALSERQSLVSVWRTNYSWMPVNFLATAAQGAALAMASQALGLFGIAIFTLPLAVAWYSFKLYMAKSLEVRQRNAELQTVNETLQRANDRLEESHLSVIGALIGALEAKQTERVIAAATTMTYAVQVAETLGLSTEEKSAIKLGALFHDIGTIGVPEHLLRKAGALDEQEWSEVKAHPVIGANLLANVPMLERVRPIVLAHHERYDGSGYPAGLKEDQIPLAAQIIAVADAFQAMTQTRPYRRSLSRKAALRELRANAGTQFNPVVVEAFISAVIEARRTTRDTAASTQIYQQALEAVRVR